MKRDIAERLAATAVAGLRVEDAQRVIAVFLAELARCPVCNGTGTTTFGRDVQVRLADPSRRGRPGDEDAFIPMGTEASCPRCGSLNAEVSGKGDPEWVGWHCVQGERDETCRNDRKSHEERRNGHAGCGWRTLLPYEPDPTT